MPLFRAYLKQHRKMIFSLLLFSAVFLVAFLLYHLPAEAVLYPALLCLLSGTLIAISDFFHVRRKIRRLSEIRELTAAMMTALPAVETVEDAAYQEIIEKLRTDIADFERSAGARYQDMIEYYTVWVHQIKTPISSMRLTLQKEDSPLSRKLSSELFRIEQYVEMVMAFLRLDAQTSDYVFAEHRLDAIIRQSVKKFAAEFIGRKIRLDYEPIRKTVITDDKWLCFVIEQVLSNALKYTREGCVRIYLKKPKTLCIEDTGIGIVAEDLPRIFEKGYTGYNGRSDKKASGIGLYLCRRICKNLGAGIRAQSEPDKGTAILIDLEQYPFKKE